MSSSVTVHPAAPSNFAFASRAEQSRAISAATNRHEASLRCRIVLPYHVQSVRPKTPRPDAPFTLRHEGIKAMNPKETRSDVLTHVKDAHEQMTKREAWDDVCLSLWHALRIMNTRLP